MKTINTILKKMLASMALFLCAIGLILMIAVPANAQGVSDVIRNVGGQTTLPSFETAGHASASVQPGANILTSAIYYVVDLVKYVIGTLAVITITLSGIRLVTGAKATEEQAKKQKEQLLYTIMGFVIIMIADPFIKQVFFGSQGEIYSSQSTLQQAATNGSLLIRGIYEMIAYFSGAIAVLMIVISGFRYMTSGGNEELMGKSKKAIIYAVLGLLLVGIAEYAVKDVIFPQQGAQLTDVEKLKTLVINLTNFVSGFLTTIAAVMYIYGGYLYVVAFGNEEATGKAKKVFIGATIGLLLAMGAFGIVNTTIKLENQVGPTSSSAPAGSAAPASLPTSGKIGG